ncbi:MAG: DUF4445 domain-containing protein [Deltaproteobacteria bacterium]|nr:DUF4445 domain-containing protein [Deltaproteobacteria bacterium]
MERTRREDGWIRVLRIKTDPPSLKNNTADVDRLTGEIKKVVSSADINVDISAVRKIPHALRQSGYHPEVAVYSMGDRWRIIDIFTPGEGRYFGLSIDLGSSTLVVRLLDLETGKVIDERSYLNPQIEIGPDILTRIKYSSRNGGLDELRSLLIKALNKEISSLANENGIEKERIIGLSASGNTAMTHFFLGLDPYWICREPYIPVINCPDTMNAADLDLDINPRAPVFVLPNVGSYFGGDLIAGILSSGIYRKKDISILVDMGTNAEVVMGNREWMVACAGAAGPALEGDVAGIGMMAGPGIIDSVMIDPVSKDLVLRTIDNKPAAGICGSGLIDLVANLFLAGMIDMRGKYDVKRCGDRLKELEGTNHFILVKAEESACGRELTLSQTDIDRLLRSKAAMFTILSTISGMVNVPMSEVNEFFIAGTFGTYVDPLSAVTIGMLPDLPLEKYKSLGNSSLEGATLALLSSEMKARACDIRDRITYIELNVNQEFMNMFNAAKFIPHTDASLFPSIRPSAVF